MVNKRLLLSSLTVFFVLLGGDVNARSPETDFRSLDERAQLLKEEVLKLNRDLLILTEELLYPAATHVAVFLSVDADELFQLDSVELKIDDKVVTNHRYAEREVKALFRGGVHRLYTGNVPTGQHELAAVVKGRSRNGRDYRESALLVFYKKTDPKFFELKIVKPKNKRQPDVRLPGSPRYRQLGKIKDPYFGEVLFNLYQEKYFSATTGLMTAQETRQLQYHEQEAELLLGDLYLSYGLHHEAGRIFAGVINQGPPPDVGARARFYLAKNWYQHGYLKKAKDALLRIRDALPAELKDEQQILLALVLMKQNRYGEAVAVLSQLRGKSEWAIYARYNMGVGLIQIGQTKEGVALLEKIARMRTKKSEMKTLRDKANLALGFAFLGVPDPQRAKSYFREVRLKGPLSSRALLGIGWALSARGKHKKSLAPWMELQNRNDIDVAVQESLLAVPYALSELGAYKQALQHYKNAIAIYNAEIERLGHAVESLRAGNLLAGVVAQSAVSETGWVWPGEKLPAAPENRYLIQLFASHDFHETLKDYRDLQSLSQNLDCWSAALATDEEQDLVNRLKRIKKIADTAGDMDVSDDQQGCGRLNSSRHWQFSTDYKPSLWRNGQANNAPRQATAGAKSQEHSIQHPQEVGRKGGEGLEARIAALRRRISQLKTEIDRVARTHERYLQELAAAELESQRKRLRTYVTQARFGIAQVYDRSSRRTEQAR